MSVKEITVSRGAKVSTAPYENEDVAFSVTIEVTPNDNVNKLVDDTVEWVSSVVRKQIKEIRSLR